MRSKRGRGRAGALLCCVFLLLGACGGDDGEDQATDTPSVEEPESSDVGDDASGELTVSAKDNFFEPTAVSVPAGEEVTIEFTNDGKAPHTFTSSELDVDSGTVKPGDSTTLTFAAPDASTQFACSIHGASMSGQIVPE